MRKGFIARRWKLKQQKKSWSFIIYYKEKKWNHHWNVMENCHKNTCPGDFLIEDKKYSITWKLDGNNLETLGSFASDSLKGKGEEETSIYTWNHEQIDHNLIHWLRPSPMQTCLCSCCCFFAPHGQLQQRALLMGC